MTYTEASPVIAVTNTAQRLSPTTLPLIWILAYEDAGNSGTTLWGFSASACNFPFPLSLPGIRNGGAVGVDLMDVFIKGTANDIINYKGQHA